jgi:hypothetical protein
MNQRTMTSTALAALCALCLSVPATAQSDGWKTETVEDGNIKVTYRVSSRTNEKGDEVPLIEYVATTTAAMSLQSGIALMKDASRHHEFTGDETSARVAVLADDEWVIHSHYRAPWPFPDNDRVTRMTVAEDPAKKTAVFTFAAAPSLYKETGVKRVTYYQQVYTFKDLGGGKVEVRLDMKMSPPTPGPVWVIRAAFPGAGAEGLRKLVALAEKSK